MLWLLLQRPALRERLLAERDRIDDFVLETLRYESPVATIPREATVDLEIREQPIAAGDELLTLLGSANRDELHYPDADVFDLDRRPDDHLAFGIGKHFCAGSRLALLEARVGCNAILDRLPELEAAAGESSHVIGFAFRGPDRLPVRFRPDG